MPKATERLRSRGIAILNGASDHGPPNGGAAPDLAYAPPSFERDGARVVFVDFSDAHYHIRIQRGEGSGTVDVAVRSTLEFESEEDGRPAFCLRQPIEGLRIDGQPAAAVDVVDPDGVSGFRAVGVSVAAGRHRLEIDSTIDKLPDSTFDPVRWIRRPPGVQCLFEMSDRGSHKGFLDSYLPSNFEYDHIAMSMKVELEGVGAPHRIISNGDVVELSENRWSVEYPKEYTSSSILFHLAPEELYDTFHTEHQSIGGDTIPVLIYAPRMHVEFDIVRMRDYSDVALEALAELEQQVGPFPHRRLIVYARGPGVGGMEYAGAMVSRIGSVRHELNHSYFARCVTPANGDAGWMDEAIASWGDQGFEPLAELPAAGANMARRSPYERTTSAHSYTIGRDVIAHLDHLTAPRGGMQVFLREFFQSKRWSTVDALEFQRMVEDFHGHSLQTLFDEFVYNAQADPGTSGLGAPGDLEHHQM